MPEYGNTREIGFMRLLRQCFSGRAPRGLLGKMPHSGKPDELADAFGISAGHMSATSAVISSVQSRHLPYWPACSTRENARSHRHSTPHGVQGCLDPSLGGFHSLRRADRARDR
jgi:hypothetical protein